MNRLHPNTMATRGLTAALALSAATTPVLAEISYTDGTFVAGDWTCVGITNALGTGSSVSSVQVLNGGAVDGIGEYLRVTNTVQVGGLGASVFAIHLRASFTYDLATQGPISHFNYREYSLNLQTSGDGQRGGLVIQQSGMTYVQRVGTFNMPAPQYNTWSISSSFGIMASHMHRITEDGTLLSNENPDFSSSGGMMTLGFFRESDGGTATSGVQVFDCGIDSLCVTVVPGPGVITLLGFGCLAVSRRRRA
ncbi:MAG: hypothetical protein FJ292_07635 [Planctomycetes bacterium]|nr:hypothetical protein [Planctomycetota bacterium]